MIYHRRWTIFCKAMVSRIPLTVRWLNPRFAALFRRTFMKTFSAKASEVERKWYIVDAKDRSLGRVAVTVANLLRGKGKAIFTPHVDTGDYVVVINAEKVRLTGKK